MDGEARIQSITSRGSNEWNDHRRPWTVRSQNVAGMRKMLAPTDAPKISRASRRAHRGLPPVHCAYPIARRDPRPLGPSPDPFEFPVRRPVLPPHYDWHTRRQQPAPSAYSDYGPEPAWLRDIRAADGGVDEPAPDTAGAGTRVERHWGREMGTGSDGQWAGNNLKSASANAYRD
ncbi:hypothetical protein DL765_001689 [Monosporascus sp. GIB2]|nr:hypothetical protein DL765_001689 [Monosporascus sp. GIB2]